MDEDNAQKGLRNRLSTVDWNRPESGESVSSSKTRKNSSRDKAKSGKRTLSKANEKSMKTSKGRVNKANRNDPEVVEVAPIAEAARMRPRHWGGVLSFMLMVLVPTCLFAAYLWLRADDQYASKIGFTIRQEGSSSAADMVGAFANIAGSSAQSDTDIIYQFVQNQNMLVKIDNKHDLVAHYSGNHSHNPFFSLKPNASLEEKVIFWRRIARISYDQSSRLIEVEVLAFSARKAQLIAEDILAHCQELINELNATARADRIKYAHEDLGFAVERLKTSREELILFRTRNKIVDLEADIQGRLGVVITLQQQLAEALVELDLLALNTSESDPRFVQAKNLINVIRKRIEAEQGNVISGQAGTSGRDYPTLLAQYEGLTVNREYAEESYRAALAALDVARAEASRQSSYLATYLKPTLPQSPEYPRRWILLGLAAMFLTLIWSILALVYYSVRDSR